jgi:hypothetical protein
MTITPADSASRKGRSSGDPVATSAVRQRGEARIAQDRAMLSQKPGTATAFGRAATAARPAPLWLCLCGARNRLRDTTCRHCGGPKP